MKTFPFLAICALLVVVGFAWKHYLRVPSNSGQPIDIPSVLRTGELVYEPHVRFELPIKNLSKEEIQVATVSDCSCIQIVDRLLKLGVSEQSSVRGDVNLNRFRDDTKLRWRFSQDIALEVHPFNIKKTVTIEGEVYEPLRLAGNDLAMTIDSEDPSTFECIFPGVVGDEFELGGTSCPGLTASISPNTASLGIANGHAINLRLDVVDFVPLQLNPIKIMDVFLKANGKTSKQKLQIKIIVLKPLRMDSKFIGLGVVSPGKQQLRIPYRFVRGSDASLILDEVKFGEQSIVVEDVDGCVLVDFEVFAGPPQNRLLRIPFSFRHPKHRDPIRDEVVVPVSYSCI